MGGLEFPHAEFKQHRKLPSLDLKITATAAFPPTESAMGTSHQKQKHK